MKGKVFRLSVLSAIVVGVMAYFGFLKEGNHIEVKARYRQYACSANNIDMNVISVSDTAYSYLLGKDISPEAVFKQTKLTDWVVSKASFYQSGKGVSLPDFILIGYVREPGPIPHCTGAVCFKVERIKHQNESQFTEF